MVVKKTKIEYLALTTSTLILLILEMLKIFKIHFKQITQIFEGKN
jgi:hypothetical protein